MRRDQRRAEAAEEQVDDEHDQDERLDQRLLHLVDGGGDEGRRVVGDLPGQVLRESSSRSSADALRDRFERRDRVGAGRLIDARSAAAGPPLSRVSRSRLAAPSSSRATSPSRSTEPSGLVRMTMFSNSSAEVEPALGLDVELQLLVVGDRPRADAADRGLHVLRLDRVDDVAGGQVEAGQPVGPDPGAHRVVLRAPQRASPTPGVLLIWSSRLIVT